MTSRKDDKRMGRPRKTDGRSTRIIARFTVEERVKVEARAATCNLSLSDYIRAQALDGHVLVKQFNTLSAIDRHDLTSLVLEFARRGSNLNQIAHRCNASGDSFRAEGILDHLAVERECVDELRAIISRIDDKLEP